MASLSVVFAGPPEQRLTVKVTAMMPLSTVLEEACARLKPALSPSMCSLHFGKKTVDLSTSFRMANIPAGSRLDLVVDSKAAAPAANTASSHQTSHQTPSHTGHGADIASTSGLQSEAGGRADQLEASGQGRAADVPQDLAVDRPVSIYTRTALEEAAVAAAAAAQSQAADPPDEFFEMDVTDYAVFSRSLEAKKKATAHFKTASLREAEEQSRMHSFGPVPVHVYLPDGHVIQATFSATEEVAAIQRLVASCLMKELRGSAYLYTAPPKEVLKDGSVSLYKAGLVPAARLYCGIGSEPAGGHEGSLLCPEAAAIVQTECPVQQPDLAADKQAGSTGPAGHGEVADGAQGQGATGVTGSASGPAKYSASGSKIPKWMKVGK